MAELSKICVDRAFLADHLSLSTARIHQLEQEGVISKESRGLYPFADTVRNYTRFLKKTRRRVASADGEGDANAEWQKERARLTKAKADVAEMQAAIMKGTVHESGSVEAVWTDMLMSTRARLLAIPRSQATLLAEEEDANKIEEILTSRIDDALNELSDYDPSLVTDRFIQENQQQLEAAGEAEDF